MGLMDDIRAEQEAGRVSKCPVSRLLVEFDAKDTADFNTALVDDSIPNVAIARALGRHGHTIRADAIGNHRQGRCACAR